MVEGHNQHNILLEGGANAVCLDGVTDISDSGGERSASIKSSCAGSQSRMVVECQDQHMRATYPNRGHTAVCVWKMAKKDASLAASWEFQGVHAPVQHADII